MGIIGGAEPGRGSAQGTGVGAERTDHSPGAVLPVRPRFRVSSGGGAGPFRADERSHGAHVVVDLVSEFFDGLVQPIRRGAHCFGINISTIGHRGSPSGSYQLIEFPL